MTEGITIVSWKHRAVIQSQPCLSTHKNLSFPFAYKGIYTHRYESPGHFLQSHYRYKMGRQMIASPTEDGVQEESWALLSQSIVSIL